MLNDNNNDDESQVLFDAEIFSWDDYNNDNSYYSNNS